MKNKLTSLEKKINIGVLTFASGFFITGIIFLRKTILYCNTAWGAEITSLNALANVVYFSAMMLLCFISCIILVLFCLSRLKISEK